MLGFWLFQFNAGSLAWAFVCYCVGVVFVSVIFVWLFEFNNVLWYKFVEI